VILLRIIKSMCAIVDFESLVEKVERWGWDKGILKASDSKTQLLKTMAELGELADATSKDIHDDKVDGVGDVLVTLILYCKLEGLDIRECLESAYNEIQSRNGSMKDGLFVKDED
jgi:NTP pyrophosphatase (non-canonical NTP hydrolase)